MLTRRAFLATAAVAPFANAVPMRAARYDLVVQGGRVIDPARRVDRIADVAVSGGRIAAIESNIAADEAADAIDAREKLVTPGLIDLHVHVATPDLTPGVLLRDGVTSMVDGGSAGADNVDALVRVAEAAPNRVRIFLNIARTGVATPGEHRFDVGNGRTAHITWDMAEKATRDGFWPDTISSDITGPGRTFRVFDLPTIVSKFLMLGMPLSDAIACVTSHAAASMPAFKDLGSLRVGAPADIAVMELRDGSFEFVDNIDGTRTGRQKLVSSTVVMNGKRVG